MRALLALAVALPLALPAGAPARLDAGSAAAKPAVKLTRIVRLSAPVTHIAAPAGDPRRLFVVEKPGTIRVLVDGQLLSRPFLDLTADVQSAGNEQGLLSLAFAPDYERSGRVYVFFTDREENIRVQEFRRSRRNENWADPATRRELLHVVQPSGEHYGGMLLFGPDGYLYLSIGDGGFWRKREPMRAQWHDVYHGKILRLDPRPSGSAPYRIPASNPFVGTDWLPEIWAYGFRNPWRFWIDRDTSDLFVGDAGEYVRESIDYAPRGRGAGRNFGWPCFEGGLPSSEFPAENCPGAVPPLFEYAREGGNCAIIGGLVVRDPRLPGLWGRYLYADHCQGELRSIRLVRGKAASERSLGVVRPGIGTFGEDALGRVYIGTIWGGDVYRLDPLPASAGKPGARPVLEAASGRQVFAAAGCGGCHTLAAAGAAGTVGPSLDGARPSFELVVDRVTNGKNAMPSFKDLLSRSQIEAVAEFVVAATRGG